MTVTPNEVAKVQAEAAVDARNHTIEHIPGGNPGIVGEFLNEAMGNFHSKDTQFLKDVYREAYDKAK